MTDELEPLQCDTCGRRVLLALAVNYRHMCAACWKVEGSRWPTAENPAVAA